MLTAIRPPHSTTALLTALHAAVDALCACCMFMAADGLEWPVVVPLFITYNVLAFMTQPLVGLWMDARGRHPLGHLLLAVGLLTAGGVLAGLRAAWGLTASPYVMVTLIGLGNAVFHVYGGRFVAASTRNDIRHLGIFVSSGALGLLLGSQGASCLLLCVLVAGLIGLTLAFAKADRRWPASLPLSLPRQEQTGWLVGLLVLVVFIRSFIGKIEPTATQAAAIPYYATWAVLLAVVGKATGGWIALTLGRWQALTGVLLLAGVSFLLGFYHAGFMLVMTLLINFSMPITLQLANSLLPRRQGLAFGLLAAVLAPGVGLGLLCQETAWALALLYPLVATLVIEAVVLLCLGERRWQVLGLSVVVNVITNLSLNLWVMFGAADYPSALAIAAAELLIVLVEAVAYSWVTRSWRQALAYSLVCNAVSCLLGLLYSMLAG